MKIENWAIIPWADTYRIVGDLFDDELKRAPDGTNIMTSAVDYIDFKHSRARTQNNTYVLGSRAQGTRQMPADENTGFA